MKSIKLALTFILVLILTACASGGTSTMNTSGVDQQIYEKHAATCTFKDGRVPAPDWICGYPISEYAITEIGYSRSNSEEEAKHHAMAKLASRINSDVRTTAVREVRASGGRELVNFNSTTTLRVSESLQGSRILLRMIDPTTNGLHVLVVMDEESYEKAVSEARQNALYKNSNE